MKALVVVDCEASGPCPGIGELTEFGAVHVDTGDKFYGLLVEAIPSPVNPAIPQVVGGGKRYVPLVVFTDFAMWIAEHCKGRAVFVSDNPAYDWQWINYWFHHTLGRNPFGFSARRIGDFAAGLAQDFSDQNSWKDLRTEEHSHHPVIDAVGNAGALRELIKRAKT
jgi:hypothetical protein